MGKNPSVIQINGNRYDAITGKLIEGSTKGPNLSPPRRLAMDGFKRPQLHRTIKHAVPKVVAANPASERKRQPTKPAHTVHRRTQRSRTLMRGIVARPPVPKKPVVKENEIRRSHNPATTRRISKAMNVAKSASVRRFDNPLKPSSTRVHAASTDKQVAKGEIMAPKLAAGSSAAMSIQPVPSMITSVSHQNLERMLDEALLKADAHKQAVKDRLTHKRRSTARLKQLPTWMVVSLVVLIIGFAAYIFAWKSIPQVSMKMMALRSSIKGSIPAYVPSGFKFAGPIHYADGALKITYKNAPENRSFTITEQRTNWDSSSLEANALPANSQVQTSQVKGTTVYIYDSSNDATWVSSGIRYTIKDGAQLNSDQLLKIADSL